MRFIRVTMVGYLIRLAIAISGDSPESDIFKKHISNYAREMLERGGYDN